MLSVYLCGGYWRGIGDRLGRGTMLAPSRRADHAGFGEPGPRRRDRPAAGGQLAAPPAIGGRALHATDCPGNGGRHLFTSCARSLITKEFQLRKLHEVDGSRRSLWR